MADDDYWDGNAEVDEYFFYGAGVALNTDELTQENQNSNPYHYADRGSPC